LKIEFVNHASFILDTHGIRMISDPWLIGTCFNDGWGLLSPTALDFDDFKDITHLWFSHEHPDHFHPPSLRKIPEEHRKNITVLFQATGDHKVVEFCKILKFKDVIEMPAGEYIELAPGVEMMCYPWEGFEDSWSYITTPDGCILNLNDCTINTEDEIRHVKSLVGEVDVLFTQFSISAWDGNIEELDRRKDGSRLMLERTYTQANIFEADYVVPFASYIWFCHAENDYMNEAFLSIDELASTLADKSNAEAVFMYPGDSWVVGEKHSCEEAKKKYAADQDSIATRPRVTSRPAFRNILISESHGFCGKIAGNAHRSKLRLHLAKTLPKIRRDRKTSWTLMDKISAVFAMLTLRIEPARIYLTDFGESFYLDIFRGLRPADLTREECDIAMASDSLMYSFKHLWGGETLHINGRFQRILPEGRGPVFHYYSLAGEQNANRQVSWRTLPHDLGQRLGLIKD
jgi:UDP-MurNAc hydroxylase